MKIYFAGALCLLAAGAASGASIVGLTTSNRLVTFDSAAPGVSLFDVAVNGLEAGESLIGIDLRPQTGQLIGVTRSGIYSLDSVTGAATRIGMGFAPALGDVEYGIDFNPTVDRIRFVSSEGGNGRLNPVTGGFVMNDTALAYGSGGVPRAVAVAYTNSIFNSPLGSIRELAIDSANDSLIEIGTQAGGNPSFNGGVTTIIGSIGVDTGDLVGFDIFGSTGMGFISTTPDVGGVSSLRSINLFTGATSFLGDIAGGTFRDITVVPAPGAAFAMVLFGLGAVRRKR